MLMTIHERAEIDALCSIGEGYTTEQINDVLTYREYATALCIKDPVFWINAFVWTFDPRKEDVDKWKPFLLFPKQEDYVRWAWHYMSTGESFGTEKSREVGATWLALALFVHQWLFTPGFTAKVGSHVEDKVYKKGDPDCHFWKMQFMVDMLPDWMKPEGWNPQLCINENRMAHPNNQSVITGAAPTENFGRGGRVKVAFFDELQDWLFAKAAWDAASQTTNCRIATGTPKGANFYGSLMNPQPGRPGLRKFVIDWRDDPRKNTWIAYDTKPTSADFDPDSGLLRPEFLGRVKVYAKGVGWATGSSGSNGRVDNIPDGQEVQKVRGYVFYPWYSYQELRVFLGDIATLAQEVDRDYRRSVVGVVYPQFAYVKRGRFLYNRNFLTYCGWDFGLDTTAVVWVQYDPRHQRYYVIDYVESAGKLIDWFVPFFPNPLSPAVMPSGQLETYTEAEREKIKSHEGWVINGHFGDNSGKNTSIVADYSALDILRDYDIDVQTNSFARAQSVRVRRTRPILLRTSVDTETCRMWITCMENYKWPEKPEGSQSTAIVKNAVHNLFSHGATSFEYLCVNNPHDQDNPSDFQDGNYDGVVRSSRYNSEDEDTPRNYGITGYGC